MARPGSSQKGTNPEGGSQRSQSPKQRTSRMPSQKVGIAMARAL